MGRGSTFTEKSRELHEHTKDLIRIKLAVNNTLGHERVSLDLDEIIFASKEELAHLITRDISMSRLDWAQIAARKLVVIVPEGTYASARAKISIILTDIYTKGSRNERSNS